MEEAKQGQIAKVELEGPHHPRHHRRTRSRSLTYSPGPLGDIWMVGDLLKYGVKVSRPSPRKSSRS